MNSSNILLTGRPGVGKTTLIQNLSYELQTYRPAGFYTAEIREKGKRRGFELISLGGKRMILAEINYSGQAKVGKYGVDLAGFEAFLDHLILKDQQAGFIIIDEIGKMECLSTKFIQVVKQLLNSVQPLVATVAVKGSGFIDKVKQRNDVEILQVTEKNRSDLVEEIKQRLLASLI